MPADPRIYFAAERTLLAWVRTGIAVVGLGFLVARFGLFLRLFAAERGAPASQVLQAETQVSALLGIGFVLVGALSIAVAAVQHRRHLASLPAEDRPGGYSLSAALWMAGLVAAASGLLAVHLAVTLVAAG